MPLHFHKYIKPEGEVGIWKIKEPASYFLNKITLTESEQVRLNKIKGHLKIEWLASRYLLHKLSGRKDRGALLKDEFGKPYLDESLFHISLSHSAELAAVAASKNVIGIDIQKLVPKIKRIAKKFMREEELKSIVHEEILHMHIYWGAKECLYKSYGKRQLDFRKHILVEPFKLDKTYGIISGRVVKDDFNQSYKIVYQKLQDYLLVYSLQSE